MTVTLSPALTPAKKITALPIDFIIVGGGISGLGCAVALRRVGHRITVLEQHPDVFQAEGGCRMAPNMTKILFHWGLEEQVKKLGMLSKGVVFYVLETGESLGFHNWDEEVIRETRGEFLFTHHSDLRKLLYDTAIHAGVTVRLASTVTSVDPENKSVQLSTGEVVRGDVIIGADGVNGLCRRLLLEDSDDVYEPEHRYNLWSTVISTQSLLKEPLLRDMTKNKKGMYTWFGNGRSAILFPLGGKEAYSFLVYSPIDGNQGTWEDRAPLEALQKILDTAEPRLRRIAELAAPPVCVPVTRYPEPDDWSHNSGRLLLIGEAIHPLPPGCIQEAAMSVEDGAVLAKLFSHLRKDDQIPNFLSAFQDLRTPRCDHTLQKELHDVSFMTIPPCEHQELRNDTMRAKRDAGVGVLDSLDEDDGEELPEWAEIKRMFGYDAEDDADNWWIEWGLLRERARGTDVSQGFVQPAQVAVQTGITLVSKTDSNPSSSP